MSGAIVEFFGRKYSMIIVNAPFLLGWVLYSVSNSLTMLYVTNVILGIGIGFMEAPIMTYIAETCQPDLRAVLTSLPGMGLCQMLCIASEHLAEQSKFFLVCKFLRYFPK
jgi:MFS family permease